MGIAVVGSADIPPIPVHGADTVAFALEVKEPGTYVVFARLVVINGETDPAGTSQGAHVSLTHSDPSNALDWVDISLFRATNMSVSLQGTLIVNPGGVEVLELRCNMANGTVRRPWIIAVQVDSLLFS